MEMHHRVEFIRFWSIPAVRVDALARAYANSRLLPGAKLIFAAAWSFGVSYANPAGLSGWGWGPAARRG